MGIFDSRFPSNFKKPTSASASGLAAEDEESIETKTKAVKAAEKRSFEEEEEERRAICFFVFFGRRGSTSRRQFRKSPRWSCLKSTEASDDLQFVLDCVLMIFSLHREET